MGSRVLVRVWGAAQNGFLGENFIFYSECLQLSSGRRQARLPRQQSTLGFQFLLPDILQNSNINLTLPTSAFGSDESIVAVPDPNFSPVVVLLGQDQFNQSAVVVLGDKTSDNLRPGDDISAVIGQIVTNLSPSIGDNIRVTAGEEDVFSTLLESSDQGPIVLDQLPEVLKISNPEASVEEEVRSVGQSRRKFSLSEANKDSSKDAVLDERFSSIDKIQKELNQIEDSYFDPNFDSDLEEKVSVTKNSSASTATSATTA